MNYNDHIAAAEKILNGNALLQDELLDGHLRLADLHMEAGRLERPNPANELLRDLKPLLVRFLTPRHDAPPVVCLCGSTRFMDEFHEAGWAETLAGNIVLSVGVSKHLPPDHGGEAIGAKTAAALDELHLRKIELADEVLVLNVGGYVGDSTRAEVQHALRLGKRVRWLEPDAVPADLVGAQPWPRAVYTGDLLTDTDTPGVFRKRPVVVHAFQMTAARRVNNSDWPDWLNQAWQLERETPGAVYPTVPGTSTGTVSIRTLEGEHLVSWDDWIIRGIKGELYPCKPDIFAATYEGA